jgi:hypothetical protein
MILLVRTFVLRVQILMCQLVWEIEPYASFELLKKRYKIGQTCDSVCEVCASICRVCKLKPWKQSSYRYRRNRTVAYTRNNTFTTQINMQGTRFTKILLKKKTLELKEPRTGRAARKLEPLTPTTHHLDSRPADHLHAFLESLRDWIYSFDMHTFNPKKKKKHSVKTVASQNNLVLINQK